MREDKMTSSNAKKESWKFQKNQIESPFVVILNPTFNLELFGFIQIIFLKNKIYGKQGKMIPYSRKLEKNEFEIIFNLELFGFYSNYFSSKIKYMENRVK